VALYGTSAELGMGRPRGSSAGGRASLGGVPRRESSRGQQLHGRSQCERQRELTGGMERAGEGRRSERQRVERSVPVF
jgi:hypothetical protein